MKKFGFVVAVFAVLLFGAFSVAKAEFVCKGVLPSATKIAPKKSLALGSMPGQGLRKPETFILGVLRVLVIKQGYVDVENPDLPTETLENTIFSGQYSLANYIFEVSGGKATLPFGSGGGKIMNKWYVSFEELKLDLLEEGLTYNDFDRFIVILPEKLSYAFASDDTAYMGYDRVNQTDQRHNVLYHEFGHTLGLNHAGGMMLADNECNFCEEIISTYVSMEDKCQGYEYRDYLNAMGFGHGHYSGFAKWRTLGWLDTEQVKIVEPGKNTTLWVDRLELPIGGLKLVLVPRKEDWPRGKNSIGNYHSLEYYHPESLESLDYTEGYNSEVLIRMCGDSINGAWQDMNRTLILEKASAISDHIYFARPIDLEVESYCDKDTGVSIRVLQKTDTQAEVEITFYCPEEIAPVVSVSSETTKLFAGENLTADISVGNPMAIGCGTRTVKMETDLPEATWSAVFSPSSDLEIAPNSTGVFSVSAGIPESASPGFYDLIFRARDNETGLSGEANLSVEVLPPPPPPPPDNVTATINSIYPNPATQGTTVNFIGTGSDSLGHPITAYSWRSSLDGVIGTSASFGKSDLSVGSHNVYFKVQCSNGAWSSEFFWSGNPLVITPPPPPVCEADAMSVDPPSLKLKKKAKGDVTVTVTGADGCAVEGEMVNTITRGKNRKILSVLPSSAMTDKNGQAVFTITANKKGKASLSFNADNLADNLVMIIKIK